MCTLSIVPWQPGGPQSVGVRIVCSRDESVLRPPARPPEMRRAGERQILMPVDPVSDGTWIAVSDAPLAGILMNVYVAQSEPRDIILPDDRQPVSRGTIVPRMLAAGNMAAALVLADKLEVAQFEPFRLILVDDITYAEVVWSAGQFSVSKPEPVAQPVFFTSSGLGDDVVANPRRKLFEELFAPGQDWPSAQDDFHRHVWPDRQFASVWMTRPEARTQSITWLEIGPQRVEMRYGARQGASNDLDVGPPQTLVAQDHQPDTGA